MKLICIFEELLPMKRAPPIFLRLWAMDEAPYRYVYMRTLLLHMSIEEKWLT